MRKIDADVFREELEERKAEAEAVEAEVMATVFDLFIAMLDSQETITD